MRTVAVLPVKRFTQAKQRLSVSISDPVRQDLVRAMMRTNVFAEQEAVITMKSA